GEVVGPDLPGQRRVVGVQPLAHAGADALDEQALDDGEVARRHVLDATPGPGPGQRPGGGRLTRPVQRGAQRGEVRGAEDDAVARGDVDEVEVHARASDLA